MKKDTSPREPTRPLSARSQRKRDEILRAAAELFLMEGYQGTSVDDIAAAAAVSKQTVYKHFGDKERLFTEMVVETTGRVGQRYYEEVARSHDDASLERTLRSLASTLMAAVMEPDVLRLRRLVIGEVVRFPTLGQQYFEQGPGRGITALAELFSRHAERGLLRVGDPRKAASQFTWLVVSIPINTVMLCGEGATPSPEEQEEMARDAVDIFLAAYGRR